MKFRPGLSFSSLALVAAACGNGGSSSRIDAPFDPIPAPFCTPKPGTTLKLTEITAGLRNPVYIAAPAGDARLFILEQQGRVRVMRDGLLVATAYLDLQDRVNATGEEQGLLGLAFHPNFAQNGKLYVMYTSNDDQVVLAEHIAADPAADTASTTERRLLAVAHRYDNHNGGTVMFGPDGFLYFSIGDGGGADNFLQAGQDPDQHLAKLHRIDVNSGTPYGIPPTNPWAGGGGVPEMFAWGLRNPWRFSIDPASGDVYIGDVGQGWYEEVNFVPGGEVGYNFGWAVFEGPDCFTADPDGNAGCSTPAMFRAPAVGIDRRSNGENSVVAGAVYRGACMPDMTGVFFYGDYGSGKVKTLRMNGSTATEQREVTADVDPDGLLYQQLASFGVDGFQELYVAARTSGRVYRIEIE